MANEVLRDRVGHIEILTINRPEARNALNLATITSLSSALDEVEADECVWAIILTGSGDKAFCAGMDLKEFASGELSIDKHGFGGPTRREVTKPLIAAVNGPAVAGGFELVLSCDLVVAAEHAVFAITEVRRGLFAAGGGLIRLPRRAPYTVAIEMALTGDPISAQRAYNLGLVNRVVPGAELLDTSIELAERIARNAPLAVRLSKFVIQRSSDLPESDAWPISDECFGEIGRSADAIEGAVAFSEKRKPIWNGR